MSQKPWNLSDMTLVTVISLCTAMHLANQCSISVRNATYFLMETPSRPISSVQYAAGCVDLTMAKNLEA